MASTSLTCTSSYHWLKSPSTASLTGFDSARKSPFGMMSPFVGRFVSGSAEARHDGLVRHRERDPIDGAAIAGVDEPADVGRVAAHRQRLEHLVVDQRQRVVPPA